jgi:hypothetical protein
MNIEEDSLVDAIRLTKGTLGAFHVGEPNRRCPNKNSRIDWYEIGRTLKEIGYDERTVWLGEIAGYLHDIGNALARHNHATSGALLAYKLLVDRGMSFTDAAEIMMAIGNHDEKHGIPVSPICSALIIADKSDVHKSRVQNKVVFKDMNIHDRVNLAVNSSYVKVDANSKRIDTIIETDSSLCSVADYFEIYHTRMLMCEKAAELVGYKYGLLINGTRVL